MKPYTDLAPLYDSLLRHVDYDYWYRYLRSLMLHYIERPGLILELGCGTGKFGAKFSRDDFAIFGMDRSIEMLRVARSRAHGNFQIICGDITRFHLSRKFDFIFAVHDTMNYLVRESDVRKTFRSVRGIMHAGSVFMFDITTEHNIRANFHRKVMRHRMKETEVRWSNEYDEDSKLIRSRLRFLRPDGSSSEEEHVQRIYSIDEMKNLLKKERLEILDIFSDYSFSPVRNDTIMINFVVRKG